MTDLIIKVPDLPDKQKEKKYTKSYRFKKSTIEKLDKMSKKCNMNATEFLEFLIDNATFKENKED